MPFSMKCAHCHKEFDIVDSGDELILRYYNPREDDNDWEALEIFDFRCSICNGSHLYYSLRPISPYNITIWPPDPIFKRPPCPLEVPSHIGEDYTEACLVLEISPKASAILSRRCLQSLLRDVAKVKSDDLVTGIQEVLNSGNLPSTLAKSVDAIRNVGNLAAHPRKNVQTGSVISIKHAEAMWLLDILESLFYFYYVQPLVMQEIQKKRDSLNAKLQEAGKPPMK